MTRLTLLLVCFLCAPALLPASAAAAETGTIVAPDARVYVPEDLIKIGMSREEVHRILGKPTITMFNANFRTCTDIYRRKITIEYLGEGPVRYIYWPRKEASRSRTRLPDETPVVR